MEWDDPILRNSDGLLGWYSHVQDGVEFCILLRAYGTLYKFPNGIIFSRQRARVSEEDFEKYKDEQDVYFEYYPSHHKTSCSLRAVGNL